MRGDVGGSEIQGHCRLHQYFKVNLASSDPLSKAKQAKHKRKPQSLLN